MVVVAYDRVVMGAGTRGATWAAVLGLCGCVVFDGPVTDAGSGGASGPGGGTSGAQDGDTGGVSTTVSVPTTGGTGAVDTGDGTAGPGTGEPGTGEFTGDGPPGLMPVTSELSTYIALDLGDVDGDGIVDLVTAGAGQPPRVSVYPGGGDGSFVEAQGVVSEVFAFTEFVVADVTGDGRADVLVHGTGQPPRVTVYAGGEDRQVSELATTDVVEFTQMHAVDLDGDGRAELLTGKGDGSPPQIQVWRGGEAGISGTPLFGAQVWQYAVLRGGDITGDGLADVVTADPEPTGRLFVHEGDGAGGFGGPVARDLFEFSRMDLGDVDADGRVDVVTDVPGNAWRFQVYRSGDGDGAPPVVLDGFNFAAFDLGDVDGDGRADIVAMPTGAPPRVEVYLAPFGP